MIEYCCCRRAFYSDGRLLKSFRPLTLFNMAAEVSLSLVFFVEMHKRFDKMYFPWRNAERKKRALVVLFSFFLLGFLNAIATYRVTFLHIPFIIIYHISLSYVPISIKFFSILFVHFCFMSF